MDLFITGFLLSAILAAIFISMTRKKRDKGELVASGVEGQGLAWLLPYSPMRAALVLGILGAAIAVPLLLGLFFVFDIGALAPVDYAAIKGLWAAVLAIVIVPISILQGLRQAD